MNSELINKFSEAYSYTNVCEAYKENIQLRQDENAHIKTTYEKLCGRKSKLWIPAVVISPVLFVIALCLLLMGTYITGFSVIGTVFLVISVINAVLWGGLSIIKTARANSQAKNYWNSNAETVSKNEAEIAALSAEEQQFVSMYAHTLEFLPMQYREGYMVAYMFEAVAAGRADSLKEVINLFEEQLHRWRLEGALRNMASIQRGIEASISRLNVQQNVTNGILASIQMMKIGEILSR